LNNNLKKISYLLAAIAVCGALYWAVGFFQDHKNRTFTIENISFNAPSSVKIVGSGVNAYDISIGSSGNLPGAWITLYVLSRDEANNLPNDAKTLLYFKSTYLGTSKPTEMTNTRNILGKPVSGDLQEGTIPKPNIIEAYRIRLADGGLLFIGLRRMKTYPKGKGELLFGTMLNSIKVNTTITSED